MEEIFDILRECRVVSLNGSSNGSFVVHLPDRQLDRDLYISVAKKLHNIGGKWNRKHRGFLFAANPTDMLNDIILGVDRNVKKENQFFETPPELATKMCNEFAVIVRGDKVLEPSAGTGAIIQALAKDHFHLLVDKNLIAFEIEPTYADEIEKRFVPAPVVVRQDFLKFPLSNEFDVVIANPPFSKNQDIIHVRKMYDVLKPGGHLVSIMSAHWTFANGRMENNFREWIKTIDFEQYELPEKTFASSGTNVRTVLIKITK